MTRQAGTLDHDFRENGIPDMYRPRKTTFGLSVRPTLSTKLVPFDVDKTLVKCAICALLLLLLARLEMYYYSQWV